jgi:4-aminobutyrate aminotransferase/(S)-3-amino-2-methylpropionate transaminase
MAMMRTIELKTAIPGPRSREILERKAQVVADPLSVFLPVVIEEGRGATLTDVDGNTFIDFTGGVGCLNVGHSHPRVVEAAQEQLAKFSHTDFTIVPYEVYVTLAERLIAAAPFRSPAKAAFFNAGTEAVENAIKFARAYTGRPGVIGFEGGFHGRTLLSLSLTSKTHPYKAGLGPFAPEVYRVPFPNDYRGPSADEALAALERALITQVAAETVAAIVIEPIQGEGGFVVAPQAFLDGVRRLCDEHGIVMVVDEVQTGFGRTGRLFAIEHYGIEPDLITVAKSIAAGLPLSGVIGKAEIMDAPGDSAIGGTYVGNPVAQAAALAVLDVMEDEGVCERAAQLGETIRARMESWRERWPQVGDVRGLGAMLAIELVTDPASKEPDADTASAVVDAAAARGLLLLKSGIYSNCIRVLAPLILSDAELDEALTVWEDALEATLAPLAGDGAAGARRSCRHAALRAPCIRTVPSGIAPAPAPQERESDLE